MGYHGQTIEGSITIPADRIEAALRAIREDADVASDIGVYIGRSVQDIDLDTIITAIGFDTMELDGGIAVVNFGGNTRDIQNTLFETLAPYVDEDSYLVWSGEDGGLWRWVFTGGALVEQFASNIDWA